ncbi:MAG: PQQ-binding-like beta-propeller repeat protein [Pseudorhodobacter sp.]
MVVFSQASRRTGLRGLSLVTAFLLVGACEKEVILDGERFDPRTPLEASIPTEGDPRPTDPAAVTFNESRPIALPSPRSNADWTHRAGSAQHFAGHVALSPQPALVWSANIGTGDSRRFRISAAPVVAGGRIFTMDAQGRVTATGSNGATLWQMATKPEGARSDQSGGGLAYGGGRLAVTTGYGEVLALDPASGAVIWRQKVDAPASGAPAVADGLVFAVGRDGAAWAIRLADGRVDWRLPGVPSRTGMIGAAGPAIGDRTVLLPFGNGEVVAALRAGGERVWNAQVQGRRLGRGYTFMSDITGDPVIDGAVTYIGNQSGRTVAVDSATGTRRWTATEAAYGPVVPVGGSVFLISDESRLVRLDASTGTAIWSVEMPYFISTRERRRGEIVPHFGPVLAGGRLVVASGDGLLRFFSPTDGALTATVPLPGGAASAPAVVGGVLYVVSSRGQLHAFR